MKYLVHWFLNSFCAKGFQKKKSLKAIIREVPTHICNGQWHMMYWSICKNKFVQENTLKVTS